MPPVIKLGRFRPVGGSGVGGRPRFQERRSSIRPQQQLARRAKIKLGDPHPPPTALPPGGQFPNNADRIFDVSDDPLLNTIIGGATTLRDTTLSNLDDQERQLLLNLGSRDLASSVLGAQSPFLSQISDNPETSTSILAQIQRGFQRDTRDTQNQAASNNLFHSGARLDAEGELIRGRQVDQNEALARARQALGALGDERLGAASQFAQTEGEALTDATGRAIDESVATGAGEAGAGSAADLNAARAKIVKLRQKGMPWARIKQTPAWKRFQELGGG